MQWLLENGTKALALLSVSLIVFATVHDWAFFNTLGSKFQSVQTTYDYIANAIEWLPVALGWALVGGIGFASTSNTPFDESETDKAEPIDLRLSKMMSKFRRFGIYVGGLATAAFFAGLLTPFPFRQLAFGIAAAFATFSCTLLMISKNPPSSTEGWALARVPTMCAGFFFLAYVSGVFDAFLVIELPQDTYRIQIKNSGFKDTNVLRSFEKGLLIWNSEIRTIEFLRWDTIEGVSHQVARDKTPICKMFEKLCT